ncbi:hypothetical protein ACFWF3_35680, partial [Nocardia sp. NPDC060220]|uniref:hypothetical protein n=1 Tax=Nocardia sp. NPDC060220 TaxID=3347076 RepID=UPI00364AA677
LRGNVNAIFTNLSRRNQSLIEGQLTLITGLENNEADPDQLENLFKLDHLATWMITALDIGFTVTDPPELVAALRTVSERCRDAIVDAPGADLQRVPFPR